MTTYIFIENATPYQWILTNQDGKQESLIVSMVDKYCAISEVSTPLRNWTKEMIARVQTSVSYS